MKKILLALFFLIINGVSAFADLNSCKAVYHVPVDRPYNQRILRPPFWTMNRWDCLAEDLSNTHFENSPANGVDVNFPLALVFVDNFQFYYYPLVYIDESKLHVYTDNGTQNEIDPAHWTLITSGSGFQSVELDFAPTQGDDVLFQILTP